MVRQLLSQLNITITNTLQNSVIWPNASSYTNGDIWLRENHDRVTELRPKVLVVDMDLNITDERSEQVSNAYAHAFAQSTRFQGYNDPDSPVRVNPQIIKIVHLQDAKYITENFGTDAENLGEMAALFTDEFADYIGWKDPQDSNRNMNLCELFERGFINEYWSHGLPTVIFETQSHQQVYDDSMQPIDGQFDNCANGCVQLGDVGQQCKVTMRFSFVNPRRGTGCDIHGHGHMMEQMGNSLPELKNMNERFWGANLGLYYPAIGNYDNLYHCAYDETCFEFPSPTHIRTTANNPDIFELLDWGQVCGSVHFSPNAAGHYDYNNSTQVANSCENYGLGNGENGSDKTTLFSYETVKEVDLDRRYSDCGGGWQMYMRQNMPGYKTKAKDKNGNQMRNWWPYLYY